MYLDQGKSMAGASGSLFAELSHLNGSLEDVKVSSFKDEAKSVELPHTRAGTANRAEDSSGDFEQKAKASALSATSYPYVDGSRQDFEDSPDQVELVALIDKPCGPDVVDQIPLGSIEKGGNLRSFFKSSMPKVTCRNQLSNGTSDCKHVKEVGINIYSLAKTARRHLRVLSRSKISWLLLAVLVSVVAESLKFPQAYIFVSSLLGIAPLAERLGFVTEQLAFYTGPVAGGLLNATFGNATEMIISLYALHSGLIRVVQLSLLGSILSNMLLVLGCAFFCGGLAHRQHDQKFNQAAAVVNSGLLLMAVMGLLFPAVLHSTHTELHDGVSELYLSRFSSCIMLLAYASFLYFQLKSHRQLYDTVDDDQECVNQSKEEEDEDVLAPWAAILWLAILTLFISLLSGNLVHAIEGASKASKIPVAFISVIILPIVGNAAEHASAIMFACKDKLDLSLGVAIGSSTQISMFVIPFCVVYGWVSGASMDLDFHIFETATLFITVIVVAFMLQEGKSNYFKGLMLIFCYLIVGASFFVHIDLPEKERNEKSMHTGLSKR